MSFKNNRDSNGISNHVRRDIISINNRNSTRELQSIKSKSIFLCKGLVDKRSINSTAINYSLTLNYFITGGYST